jgi:hypothetical protein
MEIARLTKHVVRSLVAFILVTACTSSDDGKGSVRGTLDIPDCWTGAFDLAPDFFAAMPYRSSLQVRLQQGSDFQSFADGLAFSVQDTSKIRPAEGFAGLYNVPLPVGLPQGVAPTGTPVVAQANPALVSMSVYLQRTCRTRNVSLYAVDGVLLEADGSCGERPSVPLACNGDEKTRPVGRSTITFKKLPNGKPDERNAEERLVEGSFDVYLADVREGCFPGVVPSPCRGHLVGDFRFYYERSRPAQPFP